MKAEYYVSYRIDPHESEYEMTGPFPTHADAWEHAARLHHSFCHFVFVIYQGRPERYL